MKIAIVGSKVEGYCEGTYEVWETVGHTPKHYDDEGNFISGGDPIHDWVKYSETGTVTGIITTGSNNVKVNGRSIARVGDSVSITKHYSHDNHLDSLKVTGTIISGSNILFANKKRVVRVGDSVEASGCNNIKIIDGSNNVNSN